MAALRDLVGRLIFDPASRNGPAEADRYRRVNALRPLVTDVVAELVDRAVDVAVERGEVDVIAEIGVPLPVATSCAMLGLPRSDWSRVIVWATLLSGQISRFGQPPAELARVEAEVGVLLDYIDELCAER